MSSGNIQYYNGKDFVEQEMISKQVYHYTSSSGLDAIIRSKNLRFTDCQFMNDKSEYVYTKKLYQEVLRSHKTENPELNADILFSDPFQTNVWEVTDDNSPIHKTYRFYLFCCSLRRDSHNMWSYFTKNDNYIGYNLNIDVQSLIDVVKRVKKQNDVQLMYGEVIYDRKKLMKQIEEKMENYGLEYEREVAQILDEDPKKDKWMIEEYVAHKTREKMHDFLHDRCLFFKHEAFESEREFRFVLKIANDYSSVDEINGNFMLDHYMSDKGIAIPFRKLNLRDAQVIKQIMLAPMMEKEIAEIGLKSFLKESGGSEFEEIPIACSEIDVRF